MEELPFKKVEAITASYIAHWERAPNVQRKTSNISASLNTVVEEGRWADMYHITKAKLKCNYCYNS